MGHSQIIEQMIDLFQSLSAGNVDELRKLYTTDIRFEDPLHHIDGIDNLVRYFAAMYRNVESCRFDIQRWAQNDQDVTVTWIMYLRHPRLRAGAKVTVHGCSYLQLVDGRVAYHRDYFDLGEMLYENLPILGLTVRTIKRRVGK